MGNDRLLGNKQGVTNGIRWIWGDGREPGGWAWLLVYSRPQKRPFFPETQGVAPEF